MLARGIERYHRPGRTEDALALLASGARALGGGTRLLSTAGELRAVVDLAALDLGLVEDEPAGLRLPATTVLQDVIDTPACHAASGGLLPEACRAFSASRLLRGMATLGGEAAHAAPDSDLVAALLALDAVVQVRSSEGLASLPAALFFADAAAALGGGALIEAILLPADTSGAALERVAVLPSAPTLVSAAAALRLQAGHCTGARVAVTGLAGPPGLLAGVEAALMGTVLEEADIARAAGAALRVAYRDDAHAPASYRASVAPILVERALHAARERALRGVQPSALRPWPVRDRSVAPLREFCRDKLSLKVNGTDCSAVASAGSTLMEVLRSLGLHGVKHGCETGECGACAVLLDGRPVVSCLTLAARAHGREVLTVEGLGAPEALHGVQQAFVETGAIQCGYCTPAMELCAKALLNALRRPSDDEIRDALSGCLCRCTGYVKPVEAVRRAAEWLAPHE
jgi:aerobic-type carbon monoxide dehydrogenase small subunit (CoxS/CutS family)/CO/xanthine dehydrogenase FAD-binding subunit